MQFREYIEAVRKRWLLVVMLTVLAAGVAGGVSFAAKPMYQATASIYFSLAGSKSATDLNQGASYTQAQVLSYAALASSPIVLQPVIDKLKLGVTPKSLATNIAPVPVMNTVILDIGVSDASPATAANIANEVARQLGVQVQLLAPKGANNQPTVDTAVISKAMAPSSPTTPKTTRNTAAGLVAGLLLGLVIAGLLEILDTSIRSPQALQKLTGLPVVGVITYDSNAQKSPLIIDSNSGSVRAEAFRQLRTNLQFIDVEKPVRVMVVTSSVAEEGKSTTAANLGIAIAKSGRSIVLVEADMRRPRVADYVGIERAVGLTNVLVGQVDVDDALQRWGSTGLMVLPSGTIPPNPSELLGSHAMNELIDGLKDRFDVVLLDTPPVLPVTDAAVAAARADGVLMIVRYGKTSRDSVSRAFTSLQAVDARVLGTVLNMLPIKGADGQDSYGHGSVAVVHDFPLNSRLLPHSTPRSAATTSQTRAEPTAQEVAHGDLA